MLDIDLAKNNFKSLSWGPQKAPSLIRFIFLFQLVFFVQATEASYFCAQVFNLDQKLTPINVSSGIKYVEQESSLKELLLHSNRTPGQSESIKEHSQNVLRQFQKQKKASVLDEIIIALHDIGKPFAIEAGDRGRQHEFTLPILEDFLQRHQFDLVQRSLAKELVLNQSFSKYLKNEISAEEAIASIKSSAEHIGLRPLEFYKYKLAFYISDAGSYEIVRLQMFDRQSSGRLVFKDVYQQKLQILESKLEE